MKAVRALIALALACAAAGCAPHGDRSVRVLARVGPSAFEEFLQQHVSAPDLTEYLDRLTIDPKTGVTYAGYVAVYDATRHEKTVYSIQPDGHMNVFAKLGACGGYSSAVAFNPIDRRVYATCGNAVVRIEPSGRPVPFAGSQKKGHNDGLGSLARFDRPFDLVFNAQGDLYVADFPAVRMISPSGAVTTIAGHCRPKYGKFPGCHGGRADARGVAAQFTLPVAVAVDSRNADLYVVDEMNENVRSVDPGRMVRTFAGGCLSAALASPCPKRYGYHDGAAASALFNAPMDITYDPDDEALYIADWQNDAVRRMTAAGDVTTLTRGVRRPRGVAYNPVTHRLEIAAFPYIWAVDTTSIDDSR